MKVVEDRARRRLLTLGFLLVVSSGATAQERLYKWFGDQSNQQFGRSVGCDGDLNSDGVADFVVGAPSASTDLGMLRALSGSDGSVLWSLFGNSGEALGISTAMIGDVDNDGVSDFVTGSGNPPNANPSGWGVVAYSGATRTPLYYIDGMNNERLGSGIAPMSDLDGDGVTDYALSERFRGNIHVISGRYGTLIYLISAPSDAAFFSYAISSSGDVDGDGVSDLVVGDPEGAPGGIQTGAAWVYTGSTGRFLYELAGAQQYSNFGTGVALIHDLDSDGLSDVVIGAPDEVTGLAGSGHVHVFSGGTGAPLMDLSVPGANGGYIELGCLVADGGDVNGDGFGDFFADQAYGGELNNPSSVLSQVHLYSGRDGGEIYHYFDSDPYASGFGETVVQLVPDIDGDHAPEVMITNPWDNTSTLAAPGSVSVFRTDDLFVNAVPRVMNRGGGPTSLTVGQGTAGAPFALFLADINGNPLNALISIGLLDSTGRSTLSGVAPPGLSGNSFGFTAFTLNASSKIIASGVETVSFQ
jgi:hypothetical protein